MSVCGNHEKVGWLKQKHNKDCIVFSNVEFPFVVLRIFWGQRKYWHRPPTHPAVIRGWKVSLAPHSHQNWVLQKTSEIEKTSEKRVCKDKSVMKSRRTVNVICWRCCIRSVWFVESARRWNEMFLCGSEFSSPLRNVPTGYSRHISRYLLLLIFQTGIALLSYFHEFRLNGK